MQCYYTINVMMNATRLLGDTGNSAPFNTGLRYGKVKKDQEKKILS